jgi:dTDP-4-dehydrorhamnose reductase
LDVGRAEHCVLVVGGDGLIGRALRDRYFQAGIPWVTTSRRPGHHPQLDLGASADEWELPENCSIAFLCAGRTRLADCEAHPAETTFVNVHQTIELARRLCHRGAFVVFLSTSLVFDGSKPFASVDDVPNPTTAYGGQKAQAEELLGQIGTRHAIVRLTKVAHPAMPLVLEWKAALRRGEIIHPYSDMVFNPLPLDFVAGALQKVASRPTRSIIHLSATTDVTYASFARSLAAHLNVSPRLVQPRPAPSPPPPFASLKMRPEDLPFMTPPSTADTISGLLRAIS